MARGDGHPKWRQWADSVAHVRPHDCPSCTCALDDTSLVRRLRRLRQQRGFSQTELGLRLPTPLTRQAVAKVEKGRTRLTRERLADWAAVLGVPLYQLLP